MTINTMRVKVEISEAGCVGTRESMGEYPQLMRGVGRRIRKECWEGEIGEVKMKLGEDSTSSSQGGENHQCVLPRDQES